MPTQTSIISPLTVLHKKLSFEESLPASLSLLPAILQELYLREKQNRELLAPVLHQLDVALDHLQLTVGQEQCVVCEQKQLNQKTEPYSSYTKPIITKGNREVHVRVTNYRCPRCKTRPSERSDLTLYQGKYERYIVLMAVAIYTCGCSYENTRNILHSLFQVQPAISTIENWVQKLGSAAQQWNHDVLKEKPLHAVALDELYFYVRDGQDCTSHSPYFATVIQEQSTGAILHIGVNAGRQTNQLIVKSHLQQIKQNTPDIVAGDGCSSYPAAVREVLPIAQFVRDLVHEVRNVRKKPHVKQHFKTRQTDFKVSNQEYFDSQLRKERRLFRQQLLESFTNQKLTKHRRRFARRLWEDYRRWEDKERQALTEHIETQSRLFLTHLHRRLYCAYEAARHARQQHGVKDPFSIPLTTCQLEGFNRFLRQRERQRLCYRASSASKAVLGLLALLHNMVGTGKGCLYLLLDASIPEPRWNPFLGFLPRKKSPLLADRTCGTPLRQVTVRYGQQHSQLLFKKSNSKNDPKKPLVPHNTAEEGSFM